MKQDNIFSQDIARAMSFRSLLRVSKSVMGLVLFLLLFLTSCSTTSKLPSYEQLYIGIDKIAYTNTPTKKTKIRRDSVGVITTIADVANTVSDVLAGRTDGNTLDKLKDAALNGQKTKAEQKAEEQAEAAERAANKEAFETAKEEVEAVLAYPPNNALFGSSSLRSPFQLGLWFYNGFVDAKSGLGKWIYKCFAQQPVYVTTVNPDMRIKVAQNTLQNYGYFRSKVGYKIIEQKNPKQAKISYTVNVGPLSRFDSIHYYSFGAQQDSLLHSTKSKHLLTKGAPFSVVKLANEQTRIGSLLRENGYYYWLDDYTTYQADTLIRKNFVQLRVMPKPSIPAVANHPWYIGQTYINVRRNEEEQLNASRTDQNFTYTYGGNKMPLRSSMWRHAVMHNKGELYHYTDQRNTLEKLNKIGVFNMLDVSYVPRDTTANCDSLDIYISAQMGKRYDSDFEMNTTLKSNQQVGPGLSYEINKRNAFRGGETVSFKIFGSYEWQFGSGIRSSNSLLNSYELGSQLSFTFPRFFAPIISRHRLNFPAETTFAINGDWKRRAGFFTLVSAGLSATYNWYKRSNMLHELTPLSIDFNNTINTSHTYDSIMAANPTLAVSMRDQFIPAMSYTFTYTSTARHRNKLMVQLHAKEAGNLFSGFYAATGKKFNEQNKRIFGSPFAQFVKTTAEMHYTLPINNRLTLATRFFGGVIFSYGNSTTAPYAEQFYAGGANSVRGFTIRTIGPGSYRSNDSKYSYIDQTGDIKLEVNTELRAHLFGSLYGATFIDAGNVWLMREDANRPGGRLSASTLKNIAVGTGVGLRYDLEFLVLRFDLGIGLHAPYKTNRSGFYNLEKFKDGLVFHFAIGYPF